ncbi:MAG: Ig-like domain-containing protein [Candidatus Flemingiibacterium sp.]
MKFSRKIAAIMLATAMLVSFASCSDEGASDDTPDNTPVTSGDTQQSAAPTGELAVAKDEYSFTKLGESDVIDVTVGGTPVYDAELVSDDESIAAVVGNAVVAMGKGTTTVTAKRDGKEAIVTVTVAPEAKVVIAGDGMIKLDTDNIKTATITASVKVPSIFDNADAGVTFTSSNPDVATVDSKGVITAVGTGVATITASSNYQITTTTTQSIMGRTITSTESVIADDTVTVMVNNEFDAEKNADIVGTYTGYYDWQGFASQASADNPCYTKDNFQWIRSKIILELNADGTFTQTVLNAQRATYPEKIDESLPESTYDEQVAKYTKNGCYIYNRADQDPAADEFKDTGKTFAAIEGMEASGMRNFSESGYFMITDGKLELFYGAVNGMTGEYQSESFEYGKVEGNEFLANKYVPFTNMVAMSENMSQVLTKTPETK